MAAGMAAGMAAEMAAGMAAAAGTAEESAAAAGAAAAAASSSSDHHIAAMSQLSFPAAPLPPFRFIGMGAGHVTRLLPPRFRRWVVVTGFELGAVDGGGRKEEGGSGEGGREREFCSY